MLFSSLSFLFVFLPAVLIINFLLKENYRNYFLLLASLVFYAWGEPKFVVVMITSILLNYVFGLLVGSHRQRAKLWVSLAVISNMSILFIFKYLNFAISNIDKIFEDLLPQTEIVLPIGISFFTFQAMSYVIDVYRGHAKVQKNPFYLGLYISLFPQLIAGPIVRYTEIEAQIMSRFVSKESFGEGVRRFIIGFNKKIIIANNLAIVTDWAFASLGEGTASIVGIWLGAVCYALQIYFDFGGYSDMAIGLGKMLGFDFQENFIYPYSKGSIKGFWTENHISLCTWFRDYIYIPLGGSRGSTLKTVRNMFVIWAITGIWHGANWIFLGWGLVYFVLLVIERYARLPERFKTNCGKILYRIFALVMLVILNGVLFRNAGTAVTIEYISSMFALNQIPFISARTIFYLHQYGVIIIFAIIYSASTFRYLKNIIVEKSGKIGYEVFSFVGSVSYIFLFLVAISYLVLGSYNPFIYFNF